MAAGPGTDGDHRLCGDSRINPLENQEPFPQILEKGGRSHAGIQKMRFLAQEKRAITFPGW
jgi:hypothetical protein